MAKYDLRSSLVESMKILQKVVCGDNYRKTRFHDEKGNLVDFMGTIYAPKAFITALSRICFGYASDLPWISYRAIHEIEGLMHRDWKVLEFGSGMSTLWFAERCSYLHSIENNKDWYNKVKNLIGKKGINNIRYDYRNSASYSDLSEYESGVFDFILIDGSFRSKCVRPSLRLIKSGGYIYLDNSDKDSGPRGGDMRLAEQLLLKTVPERNGGIKYFTDFAPCQMTANQGLLVRFQLQFEAVL